MLQGGCFVTACAQILLLAGYDVTPGVLCRTLNVTGGFTADGLAIWSKITQAYPQFTFSGSQYYLVQGYCQRTGLYHYWSQDSTGNVYDPWTGTSQHPVGYVATGARLGVTCAPNPSKVIVVDVVSTPTIPNDFWVVLDTALNVRTHPSISAPIVIVYPAGSRIECTGRATGDTVQGTPWWYVSKLHGYYFTAAYSHTELLSTNSPV